MSCLENEDIPEVSDFVQYLIVSRDLSIDGRPYISEPSWNFGPAMSAMLLVLKKVFRY